MMLQKNMLTCYAGGHLVSIWLDFFLKFIIKYNENIKNIKSKKSA